MIDALATSIGRSGAPPGSSAASFRRERTICAMSRAALRRSVRALFAIPSLASLPSGGRLPELGVLVKPTSPDRGEHQRQRKEGKTEDPRAGRLREAFDSDVRGDERSA